MNLLDQYMQLEHQKPQPELRQRGFSRLDWSPDQGMRPILFKGLGKGLYCWGRIDSHSHERRPHLVYYGSEVMEVPGLPDHTVTVSLQFEHYEDLIGYFRDITTQTWYNLDSEHYEYLTCVTLSYHDHSEPHQGLFYARLQFKCVDIRRKTY